MLTSLQLLSEALEEYDYNENPGLFVKIGDDYFAISYVDMDEEGDLILVSKRLGGEGGL